MNEIKSRIGDIVFALYIAKKRGAILKGNSKFEKELKAIIEGPEIKVDNEVNKEHNIISVSVGCSVG